MLKRLGEIDLTRFVDAKSWRAALVVVPLAAGVLFVRKGDALLHPQFWAEDGAIFFQEQYEYGPAAIMREYAGYLHLMQRLIAWGAMEWFPHSAIPAVFAAASLLVTLAVVASVFSPRFDAPFKPLLALAIVLVPHFTNEVFLNIANLQTVVFLALVVQLLKEPPHARFGSVPLQYAVDLATIALCGLTGPFVVVLIPFHIWRWRREPGAYRIVALTATMAVSIVQLAFVASSPSTRDWTLRTGALAPAGATFEPAVFAEIIGRKLFGMLFLGIDLAYLLNAWLLCVAYFCAALAILRSAWRDGRFVPTCIGVQFVFLAAVLQRFSSNPGLLVDPANGPRYFYIPSVMLVWSLIGLLRMPERSTRWIASGALCCALASSLSSGFRADPYIDYEWKERSRAIGERRVVIPINPEGWKIRLRPRSQ